METPTTTASCHHRHRLRKAAFDRRVPPRAVPYYTCMSVRLPGRDRSSTKDLGREMTVEQGPSLRVPSKLRTLPRTCATGHDAVRGTKLCASAGGIQSIVGHPCSYTTVSSQYHGTPIMSNQDIEHIREIRYATPCMIIDIPEALDLCRKQSLTFA